MNTAGTSSDSPIDSPQVSQPQSPNKPPLDPVEVEMVTYHKPGSPPQTNLPHFELPEEMTTHPSTSSSNEIEPAPSDHQNPDTIVSIPPQSVPPPIVRSPPNLPRLDLLQGSRDEYIKLGVPLYQAAIVGDWKAAQFILDKNPQLTGYAITENYDTLLHVAASTESTESVKEFVKHLVTFTRHKKELFLENRNYRTALMLAAIVGNVDTARIMVEESPALTEIPDNDLRMPLSVAALYAKPEMVRYLYDNHQKMDSDYWTDGNRGWVLQKCIEAEIFDVALKILSDYSDLITQKGLISNVLLALAQKTLALKEKKRHIIFRIINTIFAVVHVKVIPEEKESEALQLLKNICLKLAKKPNNMIDEILRGPPLMEGGEVKGYPSRVLFLATKMGNTRFLVELIRLYPDIIWKQDDKGKTIFHLAIKRRQAEIYNMLYEIGAMREQITPVKDRKGNNMLHMVANKANKRKIQNLSGAALEMHRELLWYKEVEQMIPPQYRELKNNVGKTPQDLLAEKHEYLVSKGESWMNNYMLVATLIATIVFAAAFTLPGGYDQHTGIPFFRKEPSLIVFVISDAVSLIFSSTSVLIFLSLLTSRYVEHDFMDFLPSRLMFGIATLFLSIVTMMVAFSASFFVLYEKKLKWVPFTVTILAGVPVILFVRMQLKLLVDAFYFTYRSRHLFNHKKRVLYKMQTDT